MKDSLMVMPKVAACEATQCSFNRNSTCHALAITIGDGAQPRCDTFTVTGSKGGVLSAAGTVGACKVVDCRYNESLECQAANIRIGWEGNEADCLTFEPR